MEEKMERGKAFYITLIAGIVSAAFLASGLSLPSHMVFELRPYARVVLRSGNLTNWSAGALNLDQDKFDQVKDNYAEFLKRNRGGGGDSSDEGEDSSSIDGEDSSSSDSSSDMMDAGEVLKTGTNDTDEDDAIGYNAILAAGNYADSSDSSDSDELTLEQRLQGVPIDQTVSLGLFVSKVCEVSQTQESSCDSLPVITGLQEVFEAATFAERELTMPFWNNMRMESLFSLVASVGGVFLLLATLRPCCHVEQTPYYLSAASFFGAGILAFIPVIRIAMMSTDFRESLEGEMNVTTELRMPWSILLSALGGAFAVLALICLMLGNWCRVTRRLYRLLSHGGHSNGTIGNDVMLHRVNTGGSVETNGYFDGTSEKNGALLRNA